MEKDERRRSANDQPGLEAHVSDWIEKSGFEFELHVARQLAELGFIVSQSETYAGSVPDEIIEVDIEGSLWVTGVDRDAEIHAVSLTTIAECKKAHLPWVLFTSPVSERVRSYSLKRYSKGLGDRLLVYLGIGEQTEPLVPILEHPPRMGFALRTAMLKPNMEKGPREGKQSAEIAVAQLRREVIAWSQDHSVNENDEDYKGWVLFPVVVVDGKLFECRLSQDGHPEVHSIDHGVLSLPAPNTRVAGLPIDIVTREGLPHLLMDVLALVEPADHALKEIIKEENERIRNEWAEVEENRQREGHHSGSKRPR